MKCQLCGFPNAKLSQIGQLLKLIGNQMPMPCFWHLLYKNLPQAPVGGELLSTSSLALLFMNGLFAQTLSNLTCLGFSFSSSFMSLGEGRRKTG